MTIIQALPDEAVTADEARADFLAGLADIARFYKAHDDAPLPAGMTLNIRVPGGTYEQKVDALYRIASALGTGVIERDRVLYAERQFGAFLLEAHVSPQDRTLADYYARIGRAA